MPFNCNSPERRRFKPARTTAILPLRSIARCSWRPEHLTTYLVLIPVISPKALINGDFDIDAEAGGMAQEGSIWEWDESAGNPEVAPGAGNDNSNIVLMRGNFGHPDILYQDTMTIAKGRNRLFMTARLTPELLVGGSELVVRVSAERQDSVRCTGGSCQENCPDCPACCRFRRLAGLYRLRLRGNRRAILQHSRKTRSSRMIWP